MLSIISAEWFPESFPCSASRVPPVWGALHIVETEVLVWMAQGYYALTGLMLLEGLYNGKLNDTLVVHGLLSVLVNL